MSCDFLFHVFHRSIGDGTNGVRVSAWCVLTDLVVTELQIMTDPPAGVRAEWHYPRQCLGVGPVQTCHYALRSPVPGLHWSTLHQDFTQVGSRRDEEDADPPFSSTPSSVSVNVRVSSKERRLDGWCEYKTLERKDGVSKFW